MDIQWLTRCVSNLWQFDFPVNCNYLSLPLRVISSVRCRLEFFWLVATKWSPSKEINETLEWCKIQFAKNVRRLDSDSGLWDFGIRENKKARSRTLPDFFYITPKNFIRRLTWCPILPEASWDKRATTALFWKTHVWQRGNIISSLVVWNKYLPVKIRPVPAVT